MIRALVIDDEQDNRSTLRALLTNYCENVTVVAEAGSVKEAVAQINALRPSLIFLDIEMPFENGFQLFKYFDSIDFEVIFTTAYDEYAVKAFRFSALDYLLKPISPEDLRSALLRVKSKKVDETYNKIRLQNLEYNLDNSFKKIALPLTDSLLFVDIEEIIYLEADNNYTLFYTTKGKHLISKTLREYEKILDTSGFFRVSRSSLVNMKYIKRYIKNKTPLIELTTGEQLRLSTSRKGEFLREMDIYFR